MSDRDLRRSFDLLRREEQADAPSFAPLVHRQGRVVTSIRWLRLGAVAALLILAALPLLVRRWTPPQAVPSLTTWKSPTDFLLDTPGDELLRSVPRLGPTVVAESLKGVAQ